MNLIRSIHNAKRLTKEFIVTTVLTIVACVIYCITAAAWYSASVSINNNQITAGSYQYEVTLNGTPIFFDANNQYAFSINNIIPTHYIIEVNNIGILPDLSFKYQINVTPTSGIIMAINPPHPISVGSGLFAGPLDIGQTPDKYDYLLSGNGTVTITFMDYFAGYIPTGTTVAIAAAGFSLAQDTTTDADADADTNTTDTVTTDTVTTDSGTAASTTTVSGTTTTSETVSTEITASISETVTDTTAVTATTEESTADTADTTETTETTVP